jgi:hypothetical protein
MIRPLLFIVAVFCTIAVSEAQSPAGQQDMPAVSLIGEYGEEFEGLSVTHPDMLLNVCGNDLDYAYEKWMELLGAMEDYSREIDYDIRGLKTYMYVFWNADGTIAHLSFFPKPNSRNIPIAELKAFFKSFLKTYQMPISTEDGFSHYASAAFPTFSRPEYRVNKD